MTWLILPQEQNIFNQNVPKNGELQVTCVSKLYQICFVNLPPKKTCFFKIFFLHHQTLKADDLDNCHFWNLLLRLLTSSPRLQVPLLGTLFCVEADLRNSFNWCISHKYRRALYTYISKQSRPAGNVHQTWLFGQWNSVKPLEEWDRTG